MAAAVPIYRVDLVRELQEELSEVMLKPGMMEGVERLIPCTPIVDTDLFMMPPFGN